MEDQDTLRRISQLIDQEQAFYKRAEEEHGLSDGELAELRGLEVALDQCWDLLQQRRSRREFGQNPDDARVRDASVVERYDPDWKTEPTPDLRHEEDV